MVQRSSVADEIVRVIGFDAACKFFAAYGGKQLRIPEGTGRAGLFSAALTELLGYETAWKLCSHFGGERMTVPKGRAPAMIARNRQIVADYDGGMRFLALIHKYDLTERQLRTIVNRPAE